MNFDKLLSNLHIFDIALSQRFNKCSSQTFASKFSEDGGLF